ncbi:MULTISPECIES: adenylate/guanylate cyclase domain-containing protein [unclassified Bradyrhizobium]|uniref:adenylate/guanylate cyclase domain-containing protein n=1 Tax=unclassified Bradyrhizobium TaxID=2631580 RepID=UPI001BABD7BB|nr:MULTISPECIES: adenylate/guanylate cyclase domain-containing protein [unclassified Bradyrhizobium]MBR1206837.1 adenylate/guanylate cyclase domain-containing protein [Bradyrhizobium sp. AUGA SZCCT0124]MBR1313376.1 adenylate/guanylate cyclase domain-containing protein [Bradyrhizobium sp. AUGA SZCCT0051]MBR1345524.1 adenylate/guanylate cyclase domain-containing protein [Bradyrhizobium sp. AUGA SZCCT0105]MBR1357053.1 adenylate/guanylate cyclase domain-containing protein [Bradyrhizobium sp. AUGA S
MTPEPATICLGCWQNLHMPIPLRGPLSAPFRLFGVRPSRMNPNTCTICEMAFSKIMKARAVTIDATLLFADLRGYTTLTQTIAPAGLTSLLDAFYDDCAAAIWRYDGILNKTIGDAVFAIFNFPVRREDHAVQALLAAREIQRRFQDRHDALVRAIGAGDIELGIGIGMDSGDTNFGEFGQTHRDLTAVGTVVNRAARAQAMAKSGEILVTTAVRDRTRDMITSAGSDYTLKGFDQPVTLFSA